MLRKLVIGGLGAIALMFSTTAFAQGTAAEARAMLEKTVAAIKADKAKTLDQINKGNVANLRMAFARGLPSGTQESTPIVHDGVMYMIEPGANLLAIDATNGDIIWEYKRDYPKDMATIIHGANLSRSKVPAIFEDMVYFTAPDGYVVAVDAHTGKLRW